MMINKRSHIAPFFYTFLRAIKTFVRYNIISSFYVLRFLVFSIIFKQSSCILK